MRRPDRSTYIAALFALHDYRTEVLRTAPEIEKDYAEIVLLREKLSLALAQRSRSGQPSGERTPRSGLPLLKRSGLHYGKTGKAPGLEVQEYRAYIVDQDGHFTDRIDLLCENEDDARQRAKQLVDGHAVELWQGNQKIERFDPPPQP